MNSTKQREAARAFMKALRANGGGNNGHPRTIDPDKAVEYRLWKRMISRCHNVKDADYPRWGARGISVCAQWQVFSNFYRDMGQRPKGRYSIGRKDNDGNYCPTNCRWETDKQQSRNRRTSRYITFNNRTCTLAEWADITGLSIWCIRTRLRLGWSIADALTKPKR